MADADSMIERVKAALVANLHEQGYTTAIDANGFCLIDTTVDMNLFVRAAVEAMRKPTTSMLFFGSQAMVGLPTMGPDRVRTLEIGYTAMIDEALK